MMSYTLRPRRAAGIWVGLCFWFSAASWSQTPPEFDAQFLFPGFPSALNERGDAVGWATVGGVSRGWVAVQAAGGVDARLLPLPAGVAESYANDISADGIVVGQAGADAAVWLPPYDAAPIMLGRLPDTVQCEATAVNQPLDSNGHTRDVVGYCAFAGFMSGPAVLWSQVNGSPAFAGLVPLNLTSAAGMVGVEDVNDARQVVGESSVFDLDDLSTSPTKTDLDGNLPPEFVRSLLFAINEPGAGGPFGQVAGFARLGTSQQADQEIVRNDNGTWEVLSGAGVYNNAYGIAPNGDLSIEYTTVCGAGSAAVIAAGVYLDGLDRLFCLDDLLAAGSRDWLLDAPIFDNDIVLDPGTGRRRVLVAATNPASGQSGTVLLTETGALSVPAPVADFACRPSSDPLGIFCDWTPTDDLANRYVMERKESGNQQQAFSEVCQTTVPQCFDLTTAPGMTYEYRVQAVGLAGASDWQYTTATAPDTPPPPAVDDQPPEVTITNPLGGSTVSGTVSVTATVTDNVAVSTVTMTVQRVGNSSATILCTLHDPSTQVNCDWNTRKAELGDYTVSVRASDGVNLTAQSVTVTVVEKQKGNGGGNGGGGGKGKGNKP